RRRAVVDGMLVKCLPDALRNPAMLLAVDDHRIQHLPEIIDHHVAVDPLRRAADAIIDKAKLMAAAMLEADAGDIEFKDGNFTVAGTDKAIPLVEVAKASFAPRCNSGEAPTERAARLSEAVRWGR